MPPSPPCSTRATRASRSDVVPEKYDPDGHSYRLGLFEDGKRHLVMRQPIALRCRARLLRGMCDDAVPWQTSLALAERLESRNVAVILLKYGDHRLSSESDLARLGRTLDELVGEQPL
jgi:hypothetical protein